MARGEFGISLRDVKRELAFEISSAYDFMTSEFADDWAKAEKYYAGGSGVPNTVGRSKVVKTEVRDAIRHLMPNVMRTMLQARKIVEYVPQKVQSAAMIEQQGAFATQIFWENNGYRTIYDSAMESMTKKIGPVKAYWESNPLPEFITMTGITKADLDMITESPDVEIDEVTPNTPIEGSDVTLYDVEFYMYSTNGKIRMEAFPCHEFFISRNATNIEDAAVHGHRRTVTVSDAISLGIEYDDWSSLDPDDPEDNQFNDLSTKRRGYNKNAENDLESDDLLNHKFLFTECYCEHDLDGTGRPQKYVFYFGGSSYTYLHHEKVDDWCIELVQVDPVPFAAIGRSIADLTINEQDTMTSLLRAMIDNAHMANNPRHSADPMIVDFKDLMNNAIGAPIKSKRPGAIDTVDIPMTGQQLLPMLQYLEVDSENKVGVTKAAVGLDPNAMQSTDKQAVQNTIALAQGQVELIVRNIIETGLIPLFKRLLKLTMRHMDPVQLMRVQGTVIPVSTAAFNPDLVAVPNIGLGTASPEMKMSALQFVLAKQEDIIGKFGLDNPFVGLSNIYNTIEELVDLSGLHDVGRYFKVVTPEVEQQLAQQRAEAAKAEAEQAQGNTPMDPSKALMAIEAGKAQVALMNTQAKRADSESHLQLDALRFTEESDLARDKMVQDRALEMLRIEESGRKARAESSIRREQNRNTTRQQASALRMAEQSKKASMNDQSQQQPQPDQPSIQPPPSGGAEAGPDVSEAPS